MQHYVSSTVAFTLAYVAALLDRIGGHESAPLQPGFYPFPFDFRP
jgi:hypothetical protein